MTTISRDLLRALRADIDAALASVGAKHGVPLSTGNASFTTDSATIKLMVATTPEGGACGLKASHLKAAADMVKFHKLYGAEPAWMGRQFAQRSSTFTVVGLPPVAPRTAS